MDKEYLKLHLLWRSEIRPPEGAQIDEAVFEEIYRMQEEKNDKNEVSAGRQSLCEGGLGTGSVIFNA